jgi:hypothetical protein
VKEAGLHKAVSGLPEINFQPIYQHRKNVIAY